LHPAARLSALAASLALAATPAQTAPTSKAHPPAAPPAEEASADLPQFDSNTSLLVVAPHPDDESLCCAGVIQRVLHAGGHASIVWVTSGDGSELDLLVVERSLFVRPQKLRDLADRRMAEARAAATILGVPEGQQFFLGYPDRGVLKLVTDNYATPYHSKYTGGSAVPYDGALSPGHAYTGENLEYDFATVLDRVRPTLILAPSPQDTHPDHRATGILVLREMSHRDQLSRVRYWIVHGGEGWPSPRGLYRGLPLIPPPRSRGLAPSAFVLEPDEQDHKLEALRAYRTQMEVMSSFLLAFVRTTELFSERPVPDGSVANKY
jgi:LmbE family N-acetylglucosaminyl deacetylase